MLSHVGYTALETSRIKAHNQSSGYLLHPADSPPSDRPAFGGTCYTPLPSGTAYRVTSYGTSSLEATSTFQPTDTLAQAYAYPYEGTAYGVAEQVIITTGGTTSTINTVLSGTATSTGSSASATTTGAATTYTVRQALPNPILCNC